MALFEEYDATAGLGRFDFRIFPDGEGAAELRNNFLATSENISPSDFLLAGYIAGALGELLEKDKRKITVNVTPRNKMSTGKDSANNPTWSTTFDVSPPKTTERVEE